MSVATKNNRIAAATLHVKLADCPNPACQAPIMAGCSMPTSALTMVDGRLSTDVAEITGVIVRHDCRARVRS